MRADAVPAMYWVSHQQGYAHDKDVNDTETPVGGWVEKVILDLFLRLFCLLENAYVWAVTGLKTTAIAHGFK